MKKLLLIVFFLVSLCIFPQRINGYQVFLAGKGVGVKFTIGKGALCSGYKIYHSTDSLNFTEAYSYPGICGDTAKDQGVTYLHAMPLFNKNNYYKIELVPVENSVIKKIFVPEIINESIVTYPNPVQTNSEPLTVRIYNTNNTKLAGFIYNQHGVPIKAIDVTTNFDLITIGVSELNNGMYLLRLNDGQNSYISTFIINR